MMKDKIKNRTIVSMFPESWRNNPALELWELALIKQGVNIKKVGSDYLTVRWLLRERRQVGILHFHWIEYHYTTSSEISSWLKLIKFTLKLLFAKILGYHLVWTLHNLLPHEQQYAMLDRVAGFLMTHISNSIITLCDEGSKQLIQSFHPHNKIFTSYLGNYIDVYPNHISRSESRSILKISEQQLVLLFFGSVRKYKGVEELIKAFQSIYDNNLCLLICGKAIDEKYKSKIEALADSDKRIITKITWIPNDEVQIYFKAADVAVFPFTNVLTSSSIMIASSFCIPVITPAIGCSPEIVKEDTGFLYYPASTDGVKTAIRTCIEKKHILSTMGERAYQNIQNFNWDHLAEITCKAYEK